MTPTKADWDELFKEFVEHPASMQAEVGAILKTAKESERAKHSAAGFAQSVFRCVTAGGFDETPLLKVLAIGFWLSNKYHERHPIMPGLPVPSDDAISKWLEGVDTSMDRDKEGGKEL